MQTRCRCGKLASTERACRNCGSNDPMWHSHCDETHWQGTSDPNLHTLANCALAHAHPHKGYHDHAADGEILGDSMPYRIPFKEREAWFLKMPWVSRVRGKVQCEAYTSWAYGKPKNRCKKAAKYRYRPLKSSFMQKGAYCWDHVAGMEMNEDERIRRWSEKNPPPWTRSENTRHDRDADDRRNFDARDPREEA